MVEKSIQMDNVIKLSLKTRTGIKMASKRHGKKPCAVCFWCKQGKKRIANKADGISA